MTKTITVKGLIEPPFYFQVDGRFIHWDKFKEMVVGRPEIVDRVMAIKRGKSNKVLNVKMPINEDPNIALLVAKVIGDGHLSRDFRFTYYNSENTLIDEVIVAVENAIGHTDYYRWNERDSSNCFRVRFPSVVGYLLYLFGAPMGEKVRKEFGVPEWIKNGSSEIKAAFLRGLFDDECTIVIPSKSNRSRAIVFAMGKHKTIKTSLIRFLQDIKTMFFELGVQSNKISFQQENKDVIILRFYISRRENLEVFRTVISSSHPNKNRLLNLVDSTYSDRHVNRNSILNLLSNSMTSLTTTQIAGLVGINYKLTSHHLYVLHKEGRLNKSFGRKPAQWATKQINEHSTTEPAVQATLEPPLSDVTQ